MIIAYTGLPGGGKSLSAMRDYVLPALEQGRHVFCNITGTNAMLIAGYLKVRRGDVERYLHRFTMSFNDSEADERQVFYRQNKDGSHYFANAQGMFLLLQDVMECREAVLILDECHEYLNPIFFNEQKAILKGVLKYLSMARHCGHDVILITQHVSDIWSPLQNRIHETHIFVRGVMGKKTHYKEQVYHGNNIIGDPMFSHDRFDDKRIYSLYMSHDGGAKERLKYISIWQNKKLIAMLLIGFLMVFAPVGWLIGKGGLFGGVKVSTTVLEDATSNAPRYNSDENTIYVKYVTCDAFSCTGVRLDDSELFLPLDYDSKKYPIKIRRLNAKNSTNASMLGLPVGGAKQ